MNKVKQVFSTQSMFRSLLIIASISMAILLFSVMFADPLIAWFTNTNSVNNPAKITNFVTTTTYSVNGTSKTVNSNGAIIFDVPANKSAVTIQTTVSYRGESAGYVRVKFCGTYYNKSTKTILPIPNGTNFVDVTTPNGWVDGGDGYWYYPTLLNKKATAAKLAAITLKTNTAVYSSMSTLQAYEGEFYAIVDVIQPDRINAFWGRSALPTA